MAERNTLFVDVIIPLGIPRYFTYRVPKEWNEEIQKGVRVIVPFGRKKRYTALINNIHSNPPQKYQAKYIDAVLDEAPLVLDVQLAFWQWIQDYYMCTPGDVYNAALPGSFRLASETKIYLHPDYSREEELDDREVLIVDALEMQEQLTIIEISEILQIKTVQPIISKMITKKVIIVEEELKNKYKPKTVAHVKFDPSMSDEALATIIAQLEEDKKAEKQLEVLLQFINLKRRQKKDEISKKELLQEKWSDSPLKSLERKGIVSVFDKEISRIDSNIRQELRQDQFNDEQQQAFEAIGRQHREKDVVLLHGVTGSGKTQVYIEHIKKAIAKGHQVLYLLPEIALTTQLIQRLQQYFSNQVGVYHSRFNPNERVEIWNKVLQNHQNFRVIIGARSAVFLPFKKLGLVVVDEEHESTYKQFDPAPRYNARDAAIVLAKMHKAKVILGSATPSIESYHNTQEGKYGRVELLQRYGGLLLPEIQIADLKEAEKNETMHSLFTAYLLDKMKATIEAGEQIILFQNRRGYTPFWICELCHWRPSCKRCDVSLTYHKKIHQLSCHYCGYSIQPPGRCEACGSTKLKMVGFGTEKIEDELQLLLDEKVNIQRMDLDVTRSKTAHSQILDAFDNGEVDVLVGTQMVTKGLDFDNIGLVGILNADNLLHFPDFRSYERSFQLMVQVAGRSGRKKKRGEVVIQTGEPDHWIIKKVINHDYRGMYDQEIIERKNFQYPPFFRMIVFTLKHKEEEQVTKAAKRLADALRKVFKNRILGPEAPMIARVRNYFLKQIVLKFEGDASRAKVKSLVSEKIDAFETDRSNKGVIVNIDVDPV